MWHYILWFNMKIFTIWTIIAHNFFLVNATKNLCHLPKKVSHVSYHVCDSQPCLTREKAASNFLTRTTWIVILIINQCMESPQIIWLLKEISNFRWLVSEYKFQHDKFASIFNCNILILLSKSRNFNLFLSFFQNIKVKHE